MPMHRFRRARSTRNALWLSVLCCFLLSTDLIVTVQARFIIDTSLSTSTLLPQQQQLILPKLYTCCFNKFPVARSKRTYRCHNNIISTSSVPCDPVWNQNHRQLCIRGGATDTVDAGIDKKEETANPPPRPTLVASDLMAKARQELAASKARVSSIVAKDSQQQQQQQQSTSNQHNLWPSSLHATTTAASALSSSSSSSSSLTPLWTFYLWTLIGTSAVWHLFFYLLSVGYAVGIGLPVLMAVLTSRHLTIPALATLLWSVRLAGFLLWREYRAWPAWHARMKAVQRQQESLKSHKLVTLLSWVTYSGIYACLSLPVILGVRNYPQRKPVIPRTFTTVLQFGGLLLESIADWQKSMSKRQNPHAWCHLGLWQYSTHPNYLGEGLFWWGTVLSGLTWPRRQSDSSSLIMDWFTTAAMLAGLAFITTVLRGAVLTLDAAQRQKYASVPAFWDYQANISVFGPKRHVYAEPIRAWLASRQERRLVQQAKALKQQQQQQKTDSNTTQTDEFVEAGAANIDALQHHNATEMKNTTKSSK